MEGGFRFTDDDAAEELYYMYLVQLFISSLLAVKESEVDREGGGDPARHRTPLKWSFELDWHYICHRQVAAAAAAYYNQEGSSDGRKFVIGYSNVWLGGCVVRRIITLLFP